MVVFTVLPFQNGASLADLNIGILFIIAVSSVSSIGMFMAGWGSGNKFSLLGAMRAVASIVSYEIPLVLGIVSVVLMAGTLSMNGIVLSQNIPYILMQPLGFLIFFMAALAEINRSPFDLFEADQEIVAGYQTEYSGMRFAMFYLVEYAEAIAHVGHYIHPFPGRMARPLAAALALVHRQDVNRIFRHRLGKNDGTARTYRPA